MLKLMHHVYNKLHQNSTVIWFQLFQARLTFLLHLPSGFPDVMLYTNILLTCGSCLGLLL